jgi:hypothetical protein
MSPRIGNWLGSRSNPNAVAKINPYNTGNEIPLVKPVDIV